MATEKIVKNMAFKGGRGLYVLSVVEAGRIDSDASKSPEVMSIKERDLNLFNRSRGNSQIEVKPPLRSDTKASSKQTVAKFDWDSINEDRTKTGKDGEEWICNILRDELKAWGRPDLADRVEHVSRTRGDGLGYDILSFDEAGEKRFIEVKTTKSSNKNCSFCVSRNELRASKAHAASFWLYRVFGWNGSNGRFWKINGSFQEEFGLEPVVFSTSR